MNMCKRCKMPTSDMITQQMLVDASTDMMRTVIASSFVFTLIFSSLAIFELSLLMIFNIAVYIVQLDTIIPVFHT